VGVLSLFVVRRGLGSGRGGREDEALVVDGAGALEEFPVRRTGGEVEGTGVDEDIAFVALG